MLTAIQDRIRRALGLPSVEECGTRFGKWTERSAKFGEAGFWLFLLGYWLVMLTFFNPLYEKANVVEQALLIIIFVMVMGFMLLDMTAVGCFFRNPKKSEYYLATGVTRKDLVNDKGLLGEFNAYVLSEKLKIPHKTLYNVCVPMPNGNYQEIDAIIITAQWIYVLECKNRGGYFTGSYNSQIWVQHIGKEEHREKNIYKQNEEHIAALEYFLKAQGILDPWGIYCLNVLLTGGELKLGMEDQQEAPNYFCFGNYNDVKSIITKQEANSVDREADFMEKVYQTLLPYALFDKNKRDAMQNERQARARNKQFARGNYRYYRFPNGIPGGTGEEVLLRQDRVFTQVKMDDNARNPLWITIPYLRYEEGR